MPACPKSADSVAKVFLSLRSKIFRAVECGDRKLMWGTSSFCDELTGDFGGAFEAASIDGCRLFLSFSRKLVALHFGSFATLSAMCGRFRVGHVCSIWSVRLRNRRRAFHCREDRRPQVPVRRMRQCRSNANVRYTGLDHQRTTAAEIALRTAPVGGALLKISVGSRSAL